MNNVLWNFLNDFCQAYLDDILIYNKTQKKHKQHVKMILNCLWNADLQIDIWKCKFDVEETVFLKVIVSEQNLYMNFIKVKTIVNWATYTNLKEIQDFVDFVNFYQRFIKNFLKLIKSFTRLTWKNTSFCLKRSLRWSFWQSKEADQLDLSSASFWCQTSSYFENRCIQLCKRRHTISVWWRKCASLDSLL